MVPTGLVELEFDDQEQLAAALRALDGHHHMNRAESKLVIATTGSVAEMADLFIRLRDTGIEPTRFTKQTPTLDDVFFKILGEGNGGLTCELYSDMWTMTKRSLRHTTRSLDTIITVVLTPIAMLLLFVFVFGGALGAQTGSIEYVDFITPGVHRS